MREKLEKDMMSIYQNRERERERKGEIKLYT